ncbi:MAG TPA: hypothetical protein VFM46_12460 [Pseudomonadales bacterium]|nr:hypothetical protein [Pseudomonadales bacterium]
MADLELPGDGHHILIVGRNGSGKSRAAVWHLAQKDLANSVWIVINHKREELINSIPGAVFLKMNQRPPKKHGKFVPGIYIYTPRPDADDPLVTELLWWVYDTENIGTYIDEGYMISPRDPALNALYTQGRSKKTPVITLSQRPSGISRFAVSEAAFHQVFHLVDKRDRKTIQAYLPVDLDDYMVSMNGAPRKLPDYHSIYYSVNKDKPVIMAPVPSDEDVLEIFAQKLLPPKNRRWSIL